jgi:5-methylcytosine-specific restriction endonuclease McrA
MSSSYSTSLSKTCTHCSQTLPATPEFFYRDSRIRSGLRPECKDCRSVTIAAWRTLHPDYNAYSPERYAAHRARHSTYARNHAAMKRGNGGRHTSEDVERQYEEQGRRCFYCGEPLTTYHVEHAIPLCRGGSNGPDNLVVSCPDCNRRKGRRTATEFAGELA